MPIPESGLWTLPGGVGSDSVGGFAVCLCAGLTRPALCHRPLQGQGETERLTGGECCFLCQL